MKGVRQLYHFLGSVYFAILLIAATALFVIAGTFIESWTQSHRYAALFTYSNPLFAALLWGFFVNILFSATRRWPFRWKHLPFLATHCGLLMILAGVLSKHYFGLQGTMSLVEGTGSDEVLLSNTYGIQIDTKDGKCLRYPIEKTIFGGLKGKIADRENEGKLSIQLAEFFPHCKTTLATWIKGEYALIHGLDPIPVHRTHPEEDLLPIGGRVRFSSRQPPFDLYALKTSEIDHTLKKLYVQNARIHVTDRTSGKLHFESPLAEMLPTAAKKDTFAELDLDFSPIDGFQNPSLKIVLDQKHPLHIPLNGNEALLNLNPENKKLSELNLAVDILLSPLLAIIEDEFGDIFLVVYYPQGQVRVECFPKGNIKRLVAYDDGFLGYTAEASFASTPLERREKEQVITDQFTHHLRHAESSGTELSPPLLLMQHACTKAGVDFPETAAAFLAPWNAAIREVLSNHSLPGIDSRLHAMLSAIEWKKTPPEEKKGWLLSTYLRLYGITADEVFHLPEETEMERLALLYREKRKGHPPSDVGGNAGIITLETSIASLQRPIPPEKKLEDNIPKITLHVGQEKRRERISLAYDATASGLKWPVLNGDYQVRFQPLKMKIPYRLRLRQARQTNYANSSQPYSFEGDLIIKDNRDRSSVEKTLSMNHVHETWDGYRFYLSSIAPSNETAVKRVQIAVNYDPAKYGLTYPGAVVLSCGIFMLFALRPYHKKRE